MIKHMVKNMFKHIVKIDGYSLFSFRASFHCGNPDNLIYIRQQVI